MKVLNLVSGPRNISTALMYSFAQRPDCTVLDEPFYAVYLLKTNLPHPGREEVLKALPRSEQDVWDLTQRTNDHPLLFIKNMAHHMEVLSEPVKHVDQNIFLIRDPDFIIASYAKVIDQPTLRDLGLEYQARLFEKLLSSGEEPVVIDSAEVLKNPSAVLSKVCSMCAISFTPEMLKWSAGPKPYDGVWAPYWYANVHSSSGFEPYAERQKQIPDRLRKLRDEAYIFYEKLLPFSIKA